MHLVVGTHHGNSALDVLVRLDGVSIFVNVSRILPVAIDRSLHLGLRGDLFAGGVGLTLVSRLVPL